MKIVTLDNEIVNWKTGSSENLGRLTRSNLHLQARQLLHEIFPTSRILEEVPIPVRAKQTLYADFYLPLRKLIVEIHGEQHYKFSSFFHKTRQQFVLQQRRDRDKQEWCLNNKIDIVILPYNEDLNEWRNKFGHGPRTN